MIAVALLGGGFMGAAHAAAYRSLADRVRVKALLSRGSDRSRKLAASLGARLVGDLDEAVNDPDLDAVDICLPTYLHRKAAETAFSAGRHVFLEKPLALTLAEGDSILSAAEQSGRILMVGHVLRFWPGYLKLHETVAGGSLGRPRAISAYRLSPPAEWNSWMEDPSLSGGVALDVMIHDLDQVNWLLGRPVSVLARSPNPGHVIATVECERGTVGFVEASMSMPAQYPFSSGIRVLCEAGAAEYQFRAAPASEGGNIGRPHLVSGLQIYPSGGSNRVNVDRADPWQMEVEYFLECIEQRRAPDRGTGEQARLALLAALTVNRSLLSGKSETLKWDRTK